ncbi:zonular occludens toxin domain-containing protein [Pseudomonas aeruginosa]|uniref:zonular occludens toxin domain-containing protein n=1 Tax=Pseudomonas aeruginosa TaxID=287 RepID=UPI0035A187A4
MAIDAYVGKPGHGKSYGVVEHVIIPSLKQDRHVVTNIPARSRYVADGISAGPLSNCRKTGLSVKTWPTLRRLVRSWCWTNCGRRWPKGQKTNDAPMADKKLLAEHRHRVDKKKPLDACCHGDSGPRPVGELGHVASRNYVSGLSRSRRPCSGSISTTAWPRATARRSRSYCAAPRGDSSRTCTAITSQLRSPETGSVGDESKADARGSFWRSWGFWSLVGLVVVCLAVGVPGIIKFFTPPQPKHAVAPVPIAKVAEQVQPAVAPGARAAQAVYGTPSDGPVLSSVWRIAGYVHAGLGKADAWRSRDGYNAQPDQRSARRRAS